MRQSPCPAPGWPAPPLPRSGARSASRPVSPDPHPGGLECRALQRHGLHLILGRPLLRGADDLRQLRALQPAGGHPGGGLPGRGERWGPAQTATRRVGSSILQPPPLPLAVTSRPSLPGEAAGGLGIDGSRLGEPQACLLPCGAQGDATRSDTDEDKASTRLEEDFDKFRDLRATGERGRGAGGGADRPALGQLGLPWGGSGPADSLPRSHAGAASPFCLQK